MGLLPFKLVYHPGYDLNLGEHVFPSKKYALIREQFLRQHFADESDFDRPEAATDEDILLVHDPGWVQRLKDGTLSYVELLRLEIPYSRPMVDAFWLAAGGSIRAARNALRDRVSYNIGGGFHHAFREHGEGFCAIHDVAVAIRRLQTDGQIERAMVVDCDVHQGNGTASLFATDTTVFTISLHQLNNYPSEKPPSDIDVDLPDGVGDTEYLEKLRDALASGFAEFRPDLIMYIAGADPYREDQLGGLALTESGLKARDAMVLGSAVQRGIPVAITLAGGYAWNTADTVAIHCNTAQAALVSCF
ncbi:MAG TPA: histone deacetylase [Bryobacteraceae bacterium]|nr:histone deacetylase [Bryobacteraceae bacterium]